MNRYYKLSNTTLFLIFTLFLFSCEDKKDDNTATGTNTAATTNAASSTDASPATTAAAARVADFGGTLDEFYVKRGAFRDLKRSQKIIFTHSFDPDNKVTLKGWILKGNEPDKTMDLERGEPSDTKYGDGFYFGTVVLHHTEFNKVWDALDSNEKLLWVIFTPKLVDDYFIGYNLTASETKSLAKGRSILATAVMNPSPPKTY